MSADNGVYILETLVHPDLAEKEYRVAHCQAIEDIDYPGKEDEYLKLYFGECQIFYEFDEAMKLAAKIYNKYEFVEYGIQLIKLDRCFPE